MTDDEIRQAAKDAGIKSWHVKSIETLKAELEAPKEEVPVTPVAETPAIVETPAAKVLLVKHFKDGNHYREWIDAHHVDAFLAKGWIRAAV